MFNVSYFSTQVFSVMVTIASLLCFGSMFKESCFKLQKKLVDVSNELLIAKHLIQKYRTDLKYLKKQNLSLKTKLEKYQKDCRCKDSLYHRTIKTLSDCLFHTGVKTKALFEKLHDLVLPFVRRR